MMKALEEEAGLLRRQTGVMARVKVQITDYRI